MNTNRCNRIWAAAGAAALILLALPAALSAATSSAPVSGSVFGPVTAVKGETFKLKTPLSPTGTSTVSVARSTLITEQKTVGQSSVKEGTCVGAFGTRNSKGVVAAQRVMVSTPVQGKCGGLFGRGGTRQRPPGAPPAGGNRPSLGAPPPGGFGGAGGSFGFAFGGVKSVKGDTIVVHSSRNGKATDTTVTLSSKTAYSENATVGASAITTSSCAFVRGTSSDKGVTVKAANIGLSAQQKGSCQSGFRGRGPGTSRA
jgi:hypothetical protein